MTIFAAGERYRHGAGILYRTDARVKILATLLFAFAITLVREGDWRAYAGFALLVAVALLLSRLPLSHLLRRSVLALPFVAVALPLAFTREGETLFRLPLLGWTASREGVVAVGSIMLKAWLTVLVAVVLTSVTRAIDLIRALERLRVPRILAATVLFMYRYLFVIGEEGHRLMRARDARSAAGPVPAGGNTSRRTGGSIAWRARVLGGMVGSLFLRSYERSERVYAAMQARGYDGTIRFAGERSLAPRDWVLLITTLILVLGLTIYARR